MLSIFFSIASLLLFCLILLKLFKISSRLPNSLTNNAAVFIPIPGAPGILSMLSPAKLCTSITFSG